MANRRIEVDIVANDQASGVFQRVRTNASGMSSALMNTLRGSVGAVGNLDNALRNYNNSMWKFNRVASDVMSTAGNSIYNFTRDAINNFSELERQHAKTMGAMATDYDKTAVAQAKFLEDSKRLQQQALDLGISGPTGKGSLYTPAEVSYAQTALYKSGLSAGDILDSGAIESILKFAGGNDLDIDTATQFAVNLGTVFNKPVEKWGEMLDMVTKAADISVIDVPDIMDSLTYTGGIASGLGRDLSEVLAVISVMGQSGLRGRVAGTGMQAFFTRILSAGELSDTAIGNAPTEYVGQMYNAFTSEAVNTDGSFKDMDDVASLLDDAMSTLNDQEQAWFAKKLFGLYQMKAAYALTGAIDGDENLITDFISQIENESKGTNDEKLAKMLESQYGKIERLKNRWEGTKTDFGGRLSPIVTSVVDELFNFLGDPQNYEIDWTTLRNAVSESGGLIGEKYGEELATAIENIGNFGIDSAIIAEALIPQAGGIVSAIGKLAQGDVVGAIDEFVQGIQDTNTSIDGLPEDLQGAAEAASAVITAFTTLSTINLGTQILQIITSAFNMFVAKPISWALSKINSTSTTVSSSNSTVNANYVGVNTQNASVQSGTASVNISQVPLMNVSASIVNVYGGGGLNNPFGGSGGGGLPQLPSGGGGIGGYLGSGAAGYLGGRAATKIPGLLGSGTTQKMLGSGAGAYANSGPFKWFGAQSAVLNADGTVAHRLWNVGGKQMTASQIAGSAAKMLGLAGTLAMVASIPSSGVDPSSQYSRLLGEGVDKGYDNEDLRQYLYDNWHSNITDKSEWGDQKREEEKQGVVQTFDAQMEMYAGWMTQEGATAALNLIKEELQANGELTEDFLGQLVTNEGSTGGTYKGNQADLEYLFSILFSKDYEKPWLYGGQFADQYSTKFAKGAIENGQTYDLTALTDSMSAVADNAADAVSSVSSAINRIKAPIVNIDIINNIDTKNGKVDTDVEVNKEKYNQRQSQYGASSLFG